VVKLQRQLRYRALADVIVGGRVMYAKGSIFTIGDAFGDALVREGRVEKLSALEQPPPPTPPFNGKARHKRRGLRGRAFE
jgi:hypothetical protein